MGDPAELSADDVKATLAYAKEIIDSVVNDEAFPLAWGSISMLDQTRILMMAQLLIAQANEEQGTR